MASPEKRPELADTVASRVEAGRWQIHSVARSKMAERGVIQPELRKVLLAGWHVPAYDEWNDDFDSWNYALEGHTVDGRWLRVVVAFGREDDLIVISVINPTRRGS